jgi:hypothetical protein
MSCVSPSLSSTSFFYISSLASLSAAYFSANYVIALTALANSFSFSTTTFALASTFLLLYFLPSPLLCQFLDFVYF